MNNVSFIIDIYDHTRRVLKYFLRFNNYPYKLFKISRYVPKSKKIFIFGTGKSILELNQNHFQHIKQFDSIGLNFFVLHNFIPTIYMFEYISGEDRFQYWASEVEKKLSKHPTTLYVTSELTLKFLKKPQYKYMQRWIKTHLSDKLLYHKLFYTIVRTKQSLPYLIFLNNTFINNGLIHIKGSLSTAIDFAIKKKFETIVLCGIDLDDRGHFFPSDDEGKMHATNLPSKTIKIEEYLKYIFNKYSNKINFFISSKHSTLAKYLPLYQEWN